MSQLLDTIRQTVKRKNYSPRTAETYVKWAYQFILFNKKRHPSEMGKAEIEAYLSYLANTCHLSASSRNQCHYALKFMYNEVLGIQIDGIQGLAAKESKRLPTVLNREDTAKVLNLVDNEPFNLMARLNNALVGMKWKWGAVGTASIVFTEKATHSGRNRRSRVKTLYAFQHGVHWTRLTPAANDVTKYQVTIPVNGVGIKRRASNANRSAARSKMKLSFSEHDEFGNGRGVDIPLLPTATPKQIVAIGKYYEKVGWQGSRRTKRALDAANAALKSAPSKKVTRGSKPRQ